MEEEKEKVRCSFCKEEVKNGKFHAVIRGYNENCNDDGTIDLDEHNYDTKLFNFKYEEIICTECVKANKWTGLSFS